MTKWTIDRIVTALRVINVTEEGQRVKALTRDMAPEYVNCNYEPRLLF
jgi:hypothetical protein